MIRVPVLIPVRVILHTSETRTSGAFTHTEMTGKVHRNSPPSNTMVQLSTPYTDPECQHYTWMDRQDG